MSSYFPQGDDIFSSSGCKLVNKKTVGHELQYSKKWKCCREPCIMNKPEKQKQ